MNAAARVSKLVGLFGAGLLVGGFAIHLWHIHADNGPARHLEATVFLPLVDNHDQPLSPERWQAALKPLVANFGGATVGPPVEGFWHDSQGKLRREPVRPVVVSFAAARLVEFRRTLHDVGRELGQEAIYVRFEEPRIELLKVNAIEQSH